jgi:hypothetical protein
MTLKIQYKPIADLIPYARNSRTHDEAQVAQIAASIREFGWTNPVLLDGNNGIIAGHGRVLAAQKLGEIEVPTIELGHMSESQKRAYIIADNKLALNAGWDESLLKIELNGLRTVGFDISMTGFSSKELKELLGIGSAEPDDLEYSKKIDTPTYTPKGEKPAFSQMADTSKYEEMCHKIKQSTLLDEEKKFLLTATKRHIVFDYHHIAEYYFHASIEMQGFMEESALVIIDFEKAIDNGYVVLSRQLEEIYFDAHESGVDEE